MQWKSFKDQLPPLDTYILIEDGKQVFPHYVKDLSIFVTEGKESTQVITLETGQRIKTNTLRYWSWLPDPVHQCDHCEHCITSQVKTDL